MDMNIKNCFRYKNGLYRKFVASNLAAVFSAGTFSSYVGAMQQQHLLLDVGLLTSSPINSKSVELQGNLGKQHLNIKNPDVSIHNIFAVNIAIVKF